jgi:hypothetical protein
VHDSRAEVVGGGPACARLAAVAQQVQRRVGAGGIVTWLASPEPRAKSKGGPVAFGTKRVVLARSARNRRLGEALLLQGFAALNHSPGARAF